MNTDTKFKQDCDSEHAHQFFHWIKTRGGVAIWRSINLSNPGASWSTPVNDKDGKPYTKPNWQCANEPEKIVTSADDIGVYEKELFKAFEVGLRRASMSLKLTDGAQRKLDKAMDQCREKHGDAFYVRGAGDFDGPSMGVYFTKGIISLTKWIEKNGIGNPEEWE